MSPKNPQNANDRNRRTTLKTLLAGGGVIGLAALPAKWVKPVVDAVVLPTHAETSPDEAAANGFRVEQTMQGSAPGWLDHLVRTAHASDPIVIPAGFLCIESTGVNTYRASYDFDTQVARSSGSFGACVSLSCGNGGVDIVVTGQNSDGSFDFELYPVNSGCVGSPLVSSTTDTECSVQPEDCGVRQKTPD